MYRWPSSGSADGRGSIANQWYVCPQLTYRSDTDNVEDGQVQAQPTAGAVSQINGMCWYSSCAVSLLTSLETDRSRRSRPEQQQHRRLAVCFSEKLRTNHTDQLLRRPGASTTRGIADFWYGGPHSMRVFLADNLLRRTSASNGRGNYGRFSAYSSGRLWNELRHDSVHDRQHS